MNLGKISGIFAPITTPFENDELSLEYFRQNIRKYSETSLHGFLVLGSNGENKSLSEDEKLKILEVVLELKADRQLVMAGTGYESTRQTIAFSKKAAALGVDYVSVLTPSYFKKRLTDDALTGYYTDVADALSVPLLAYSAPGFTGVTLSVNVVEKISRHPNIAGMKDTSAGNVGSYLAGCGDDFDVLCGTITTLFSGLLLGASGGVVSLSNFFPEPCCELFAKCQSGDLKGARDLHYKLFRLNRSISGSFGVAGVKCAMEQRGYFGGDPRLPLLALGADDKKLIRIALAASGLQD